jgi:hypothetical protein
MATKLTPTERTRIVPRTTAPAGAGLEAASAALSGFFGKQHERLRAEEKVAREKGIATAQADMSRLIASNPEAARELRNSGDLETFAEKTGLKLGANIQNLVMTNDALKETVGTTFAVQGRSDLQAALRKMPPGMTTTQVVAKYIKDSTANMGPEAGRAFSAATLKFAESDSITIADRRRRQVEKAQREQTKRNVRSFYPEAGVINDQVAAVGINKMAEAYVSTGLDPVTANVKAADDYESMVIQARADGEAWAIAASQVKYAGRKPMVEDAKLNNLLDDADVKAISDELKMQDRAERQSFQTVEQLWNVTRASDFTPASLNTFATGLHREINKYRRGKLLAPEWRGLLAKLATAYKAGATKTIDYTGAINGQTIINNKVAPSLYTKEGEARWAQLMADRGMPTDIDSVRALIDTTVATQNPGGVGPQQRGVFTQSLIGQTDDGVAIEAYRRVKRLENSGRRLPGEGRYYNKEATPMIRALDYYTAGPDLISGTADDASLVRAMEQYREVLAENDGKLPGSGYLNKLSGGLGFKKTEILAAETKVLSKLEDNLGTAIGDGRGLRIRANNALSMAAWITSKSIPPGSLANAENTIALAARMLQRDSEPSIGVDDDGDTFHTIGARRSRLPTLGEPEIDAFKRDVSNVLPESMRGEGYGLRADGVSDQTNSRVVQVATPDGIMEDAVFQPGQEINVEMTEENSPLVKALGVNSRLPGAGEAGQVTFLVPGRPDAAGAEVKITKNSFLHYDGRVWKLRNRADSDIKNVRSLEAAQSFREEAIADEEASLKRDTLRSQADIGNISDKHAETVDVSSDPATVLATAQAQSIRDGSLFDDVDSTFILNTTEALRQMVVVSPVLVNRKTNTDAQGVRGKDQVIGYNFNLDRAGAPDMLATAMDSEANAKEVMKGKLGLTREQMGDLQKLGVKDTLSRLRKRIGADALASMSTGQIQALVGVVETGAYNDGKPAILTPTFVQALQEGNGERVAALLQNTLLKTTTNDLSAMTNSDLRKLAMGRPSLKGLGTEIGKRRKAGTWSKRDPENAKRTVLVNSITTVRARQAAIRAFNPPAAEILSRGGGAQF